MGNFGSALSTDGDELELHHPAVAAHLEAVRSAASRPPPQSSSGDAGDPKAPPPHRLFRYYVDACRSFGACAGMSDDRDGNHITATDWFRDQCQDVVPTIHRMFHRRGQRRFVHNGVFYYVLVTRAEVQLFTRHMKGLEVIQFLRLPDVVAPESALTQFLGVQVACLRMLHLHSPISNTESSAAYHSEPATSPLGSVVVPRHAAVAKMILSRVLRATSDAPVTMYEIGDGRLAVTDASCLLPSLCASVGAVDRFECAVRAELLIGRDLGHMTVSLPVHNNATSEVMPRVACAAGAAAATVEPHQSIGDAQHGSSSGFPTVSYLELIAASAAGKKKQPSIPVLNALVALSCNGTVCLSDRLSVAGTPLAMQPVHVAHQDLRVAVGGGVEEKIGCANECRARQLHHNAAVTSHILLRVLPTLVTVLESLPDDMDAKEFAALLHLAGINVCLFGYLHYILHQRQNVSDLSTARALLATEMVSRAGKRWLLRRMVAVGPETFGELTLALLRGINEPTFFDCEIVPCLWEVFGVASPVMDSERQHRHQPPPASVPPFCSIPRYGEASFKACMERLRDLTGITVAQGRVCGAVPVVRLARRNFTLSASDEQSVCNVAARRQDGIAGAALFAAASWWASNPNRLAKIVDQLHQRVSAAGGTPSTDGMLTTQLFFTELQFLLSRLVLLRLEREKGDALRYEAEMRRRFDYVDSVLSAFVPSMAQLYRTTPHDRLHLCREVLPLVEFKLKEASTAGSGIQLLRILLQLGVLGDAAHYHPVSSRALADELYRVSIETCLVSKQHEEAIAVAHRWARLCPSLFGVFSRQNCRATKLLLSSLIIGRCSKSEQLRLAQHQLHLCETVFGGHDIKTAAALSELGSLTWKSSPALGLRHFRRSMEIYREVLGPTCRPVCSALYNIGLALARLNRFGSAISHLAAARSMAVQLHEHATAQMCEVSERTLRGVAALKVQRWYREYRYGQAQSQTTKSQTDITTLCSTLSWSDEHDEISSSVND